MSGKHIIDASVLGKSKNRYRLKVSLYDIGIHIMGMVVQDSKIDGERWFVSTPAHKVGNRYYHDVTFDKNKDLWDEVEEACIECVEKYQLTEEL